MYMNMYVYTHVTLKKNGYDECDFVKHTCSAVMEYWWVTRDIFPGLVTKDSVTRGLVTRDIFPGWKVVSNVGYVLDASHTLYLCNLTCVSNYILHLTNTSCRLQHYAITTSLL